GPLRRRVCPVEYDHRRARCRQDVSERTGVDAAVGVSALERRRLAGARGVRHVRHPLRGPPRPAPHSDAGGVHELPARQGLPVPRPRRTAQLPRDHPRGELTCPWNCCKLLPPPARTRNISGRSTSGRSTPPRTRRCASSSPSTARRSSRRYRILAICIVASRSSARISTTTSTSLL